MLLTVLCVLQFAQTALMRILGPRYLNTLKGCSRSALIFSASSPGRRNPMPDNSVSTLFSNRFQSLSLQLLTPTLPIQLNLPPWVSPAP